MALHPTCFTSPCPRPSLQGHWVFEQASDAGLTVLRMCDRQDCVSVVIHCITEQCRLVWQGVQHAGKVKQTLVVARCCFHALQIPSNSEGGRKIHSSLAASKADRME